MTHIMLDLETMGNGNRAAIIAIGAVAFNSDGLLNVPHFYVPVNLESSVSAGLEMDPSTVMWWLQQSDEARSAFKGNDKCTTLDYALGEFSTWVKLFGKVKMWGNGAAFDNTILSASYRKIETKQPWEFWNDRCYRTVKSMFPHISASRNGTHHNALDDAKTQAIHLIDICKQTGLSLL